MTHTDKTDFEKMSREVLEDLASRYTLSGDFGELDYLIDDAKKALALRPKSDMTPTDKHKKAARDFLRKKRPSYHASQIVPFSGSFQSADVDALAQAFADIEAKYAWNYDMSQAKDREDCLLHHPRWAFDKAQIGYRGAKSLFYDRKMRPLEPQPIAWKPIDMPEGE